MSRRGPFVVFLTLSIAACGSNRNNPFGASQSRPPSADSVLVFVSGSWAADPGQPRELMATNADGSKLEQLTSCAQAAQPCDMLQVALSPDPGRIAAVRSTPSATPGASVLYFMDLTRSVEKLLFPTKRVSSVDWSADGSFLIYSSPGQGLSDVEDLDYTAPDGTGDQALTQTPDVRERSPRIDPGLRTAVYEQIDATGVGRIFLFGQPPTALTSGPATGPALPNTLYVVGADANPVFAPDATRVAFRRLTGIGNGGLGTWDLLTMASDGTDLQTIVTGAVFLGAPDWGQSGIVFVETDAAQGKSRLVVVQPDGSGRRVVREENAAFLMGAPRWVPGN
jgi:Tol biopolymer transport system component